MTPGGNGGSVGGAATRLSLLAALVAATLLACNPDDASLGVSMEPRPTSAIGRQAASASPLVGDGAIAFAITDLADQLGYDTDAVILESIEAVEWPDSTLGCPQVDQESEASPVPGYRIVLRAADQTYEYHGAAGESEPFMCVAPD
jgi:hypothetical protein